MDVVDVVDVVCLPPLVSSLLSLVFPCLPGMSSGEAGEGAIMLSDNLKSRGHTVPCGVHGFIVLEGTGGESLLWACEVAPKMQTGLPVSETQASFVFSFPPS
jgi:hypothetical protein